MIDGYTATVKLTILLLRLGLKGDILSKEWTKFVEKKVKK